MILAIGTDLASVSRFEGVLECTQNGELAHPLACRCFTEEELRYAQAKANPAQHLAAAYAAKEALPKPCCRHPAGACLIFGVSACPVPMSAPPSSRKTTLCAASRKSLAQCAFM